jgi:membrane-bound serine protease (ClpP class)
MEFLQNPDFVYLLIAGGLISAVLALAAPGTGFLELGSIFILGVAGWSVINYSIPINWWAVLLLICGFILFVLAIFKSRAMYVLVIAILALVIGSAYLFKGKPWYTPGVNPALALTVSVLSGIYFWFIGRKAIQAASVRPSHDLDGLVGQVGEAKTAIHEDGTVQVTSELWSARSDTPVKIGQRVHIIGRDGFTLLVEPIHSDSKPDQQD